MFFSVNFGLLYLGKMASLNLCLCIKSYTNDLHRAQHVGRFYFRDDGCDGKTTLGVTAELHYEQHVDVYVGMPCSAGSQSHYRTRSRPFWFRRDSRSPGALVKKTEKML